MHRTKENLAASPLGAFGMEVTGGVTIYAKALLLFAAASLLLFGALFILTESVILSQFEQIEHRQVENELGRISNQIEGSLNQLQFLAEEWSTSTGMKNYLWGKDSGFPKNAFSPSLLEESNLDFFGIWNARGENLFIVAPDGVDHSATVDPVLMASIAESGILRPELNQAVSSGVLLVGERILLASVAPVPGTQTGALSSGTLILGRYLTRYRLQQLQVPESAKLSALSLPSALASDSLRNDATLLLASGQPVVRPIDDITVLGGLALRALDRRPVAAVFLEQDREFYQAGLRAVRIFLLAMTAAGGGLVVVLWLVIDWNLLRRIGRMDRGVRLLRSTGDLPKELTFRSGDELGRLADSIREMSLSLRDAEASYRRLFESSRDGTVVVNFPKLVVLDVNPAFCNLVDSTQGEILERHLGAILPHFPCEELIRQINEQGIFLDHEILLRQEDTGFLYAEVVGVAFEGASGRQVQLNLRDVTERKKWEVTLRELSGRLLRLQDDERRKIARELHDSTAQNLSALEMNISMMQKLLPSDDRAGQLLQQSRTIAENCSREIRTLSYLLHPPLLDEVGLIFAIRWYVEGYTARTKVEVELKLPEDFPRLAGEGETTLFRIIQESLTNVYRHSESKFAWVRLGHDRDRISLEVGDLGKGFRTTSVGQPGLAGGLGVPGMRERIRQQGGEFSIISGKSGTIIRVSIPFQPSSNNSEA